MSENDDLIEIIRKSEHPHVAAERIFQLFGKRFVVEKVDGDDPRAFKPGPGDPEPDEDEREETETAAERRTRARQDRKMIENVRESGELEATTRKASTMTMDDLTGIAETICKRADAVTIKKLAMAEIGRGASLFSSFERSAMLTAVAKANDRGGGSDDQKTSRFLQDPANLLYRQWALLQADVGALAKRDTLLDDVVAKTRAAGDGAGGAAAIGGQTGGRTVFEVGAGSASNKPTEADALREQVIRDQTAARPWLTSAELQAYADSMVAAVRSRPKAGTQDRI
jgi:hypothetical protein